MGAMSAMRSIDRVMQDHAAELQDELLSELPPNIRLEIHRVRFSNETYRIKCDWVTRHGEILPGPSYAIEELAERFPDSHVGY